MFYIYAQRSLGAAKTSSFYALAPFLGAGISILVFNDVPQLNFYLALMLMIAGIVLIVKDTFKRRKSMNQEEKSARSLICEIGRRLYLRNYVAANDGKFPFD
jgi:uncharacterized membrane protein